VKEKQVSVAIYARVSTRDKQETLNQLDQLRELCRRQDWRVFSEYVDRETGSISTRDSFQKMLLHASQRRFHVLLFWSLDRLTREGSLATLQYLERLTSYQVGYRSFTEPYLDSCGVFKDVVISLLATMAKQERIRISERVKAGLYRARRQGKRLGRPALRHFNSDDVAAIQRLRKAGRSVRSLAVQYRTTQYLISKVSTAHT
jgi:DNA invertase Pin-like site-specific DNA recombinase